MANFFKKRKAKTGPNKNEAKVQRARDEEARSRSGGRLQDRFPSVQSLSVKMEFFSSHQAPLGEESRTFRPQDVCDFSAPCPGPCGVGSFDLGAKVEQVVASGQSSAEATGRCQEPLYAGSPDLCGCELKCSITVAYFPEPAKTPA